MLVAQSCLTFSDLLYPWNSASKDTGVGSHSLLQGNFPTQGSNLGLLHGRQFLYHLSECSREWQWEDKIFSIKKCSLLYGFAWCFWTWKRWDKFFTRLIVATKKMLEIFSFSLNYLLYAVGYPGQSLCILGGKYNIQGKQFPHLTIQIDWT